MIRLKTKLIKQTRIVSVILTIVMIITIKPVNISAVNDVFITRAEMTKLINRTFGFATAAVFNYSDVDETHPLYRDISIANGTGYMIGGGKLFRPDAPVSRCETAIILWRILGLDADIKAAYIYEDAEQIPTDEAKGAVGAMVNLSMELMSIMAGSESPKRFSPNARVEISRAESIVKKAAEIYRETISAGGTQNANVPILMYHTSSEHSPGFYKELYVKPSEFEKQIKYLSEAGYTFCTFDDYCNLNKIEKPVFITFDDGYYENYSEIFPILKKYNAKITLFITVSAIDKNNRLTESIIKEMSGSGLVKFESHTVSHIKLTEISNDEQLINELELSKERIEEITEKPIVALSYPNGCYNEIVKEKARQYYSFCVISLGGTHNKRDDLLSITRIPISRYTDIETFKQIIAVP